MSAAATDLYGAALRALDRDAPSATRGWFASFEDGRRMTLDRALGRWGGEVDPVDRALLAHATGSVLDVGCGPGRLVAELTRQGQYALGVDIAAAAVHLARKAGAAVVLRSVFDRLPGEGRWETVLLADGNVGIGGDPVALLRRCRDLAAPGGRVLVELDAPGSGCTSTRIQIGRGSEVSDWFDWAHVGVDAVDVPAARAGWLVQERWAEGGRWFATLTG